MSWQRFLHAQVYVKGSHIEAPAHVAVVVSSIAFVVALIGAKHEQLRWAVGFWIASQVLILAGAILLYALWRAVPQADEPVRGSRGFAIGFLVIVELLAISAGVAIAFFR